MTFWLTMHLERANCEKRIFHFLCILLIVNNFILHLHPFTCITLLLPYFLSTDAVSEQAEDSNPCVQCCSEHLHCSCEQPVQHLGKLGECTGGLDQCFKHIVNSKIEYKCDKCKYEKEPKCPLKDSHIFQVDGNITLILNDSIESEDKDGHSTTDTVYDTDDEIDAEPIPANFCPILPKEHSWTTSSV